MARFHLFNTMHGETIANVEMDAELLAEEAGIIDPATMTLRPIKNGGVYTLIPVEDHTVATLRAVRQTYDDLVNSPVSLPSGYLSRMDSLVANVGLLFKKIKYIVVKGPEDLSKLINPPKADCKYDEYEPETVEYDILGDLARQITDTYEDALPDHEDGLETTEEAEDI